MTKPMCKVKGILPHGGPCGNAVVSTKQCMFRGTCVHKDVAHAKRGPKTIDQYKGNLRRYSVMLDDETVERLRAAGDGQISPGIRVVAKLHA